MNESEDNKMQIIITGGGGFLGQKLARALLQGPFTELLLVDIQQPQSPCRTPGFAVCGPTSPNPVSPSP
jgi:nucleoside-diphosphate-sugar epimerase